MWRDCDVTAAQSELVCHRMGAKRAPIKMRIKAINSPELNGDDIQTNNARKPFKTRQSNVSMKTMV
jgi:beta-lactamase regulating signal transducer with metallopeptidase domain